MFCPASCSNHPMHPMASNQVRLHYQFFLFVFYLPLYMSLPLSLSLGDNSVTLPYRLCNILYYGRLFCLKIQLSQFLALLP